MLQLIYNVGSNFIRHSEVKVASLKRPFRILLYMRAGIIDPQLLNGPERSKWVRNVAHHGQWGNFKYM